MTTPEEERLTDQICEGVNALMAFDCPELKDPASTSKDELLIGVLASINKNLDRIALALESRV